MLHTRGWSCNFDTTTTTLKHSFSTKGLQQEAMESQQVLKTFSSVARQPPGTLHCNAAESVWVGGQPAWQQQWAALYHNLQSGWPADKHTEGEDTGHRSTGDNQKEGREDQPSARQSKLNRLITVQH